MRQVRFNRLTERISTRDVVASPCPSQDWTGYFPDLSFSQCVLSSLQLCLEVLQLGVKVLVSFLKVHQSTGEDLLLTPANDTWTPLGTSLQTCSQSEDRRNCSVCSKSLSCGYTRSTKHQLYRICVDCHGNVTSGEDLFPSLASPASCWFLSAIMY